MVHLEHFSDHPLDYITEFYIAEKVRIDSCSHLMLWFSFLIRCYSANYSL
jgi:hypothetical protein